ncbi:MAG: type II toxin-antitoxin system YafQ family toxin [Flavobacteriaceae bacterium]|jgi:mRNA interferase YafQ|nr:type II toxin-antitoxin system YafQ family toxin [Flavobacteriaceae bacterium]
MNNYELKYSTKFKKDFKKIALDKRKLEEVKEVFQLLMKYGSDGIPLVMKPHQLKGNWKNYWECHIRPNLLLIWLQIDEPTKTIYLERIGSHSDIFKI